MSAAHTVSPREHFPLWLMAVSLLLLTAACNTTKTSTTDTGTVPTDPTTSAEGWCAVQATFNQACLVCHSATSALGGLDLESDPYVALVDVVSQAYGVRLVVPGDPQASFLMAKLNGTMATGQGSFMPPNGPLDPADLDEVYGWILDGATDQCATTPTGTTPTRYHPAGWDDPTLHGIAAKFQDDDCQVCHGEELTGGTSGISCATCHEKVEGITDWTTTCTFCHGDRTSTAADAPAPPEDIDDQTDPELISFPAHGQHLLAGDHPDWDCTQCHLVPADVFSGGHLFDGDATAGRAELEFVAGLFLDGSYDDVAMSCSGGYCHSNGRATGWVAKVVAVDASLTCSSCHGNSTNPQTLTGQHEKHVEDGIDCAECHPTASPAEAIDQPELHVNTVIDIELPLGMSRNAASDTCTGACHDQGHEPGENDWFSN
jgi:predicted CxxxxCH...CXXCH cytochrome family protein